MKTIQSMQYPTRSKETHLKYAIAHTHNDDSYLIINEKEGRHPIAFFELKGSAIHWINAQGENESVGGEYPLPDYLINLAKNKELYIMEMGKRRDFTNSFFINADLLRL